MTLSPQSIWRFRFFDRELFEKQPVCSPESIKKLDRHHRIFSVGT
jgi:hypothetical protein